MRHYYHPMSRGVTTQWMLAELDVPHESIVLDLAAGDASTPEYRAINPMGKVPALVDGDVVVTEVAAICTYLADKFIEKGLAPPFGSPERGTYYRTLFFAGVTLEPLLAIHFVGAEVGTPQSMGWGDMERGMATVEAMTPETGWVLGDRFTAADVVFGGLLDFGIRFGWLEPTPRVADYVQRIRERPAYRATHGMWDGGAP